MIPHFRRTGNGPPLLLVAGTGFSGETWPPAMIELLAASCTVITFDHRGTGNTAGTPEPYSTRQFATDALDLLDHLQITSTHVLGHSMGGRVAQWMALDRPRSISSLVLAASGPGPLRTDQDFVTGIPVEQALGLVTLGYRRYVAETIRATFFTDGARLSKAADWLVEAFWNTRPPIGDYLKHVAARQHHRTSELLNRINQRTLVLVGAKDTHIGGTGSHLEQSRFLAAKLPASQYVELPGLSHGYFWEASVESTRVVLNWLKPII